MKLKIHRDAKPPEEAVRGSASRAAMSGIRGWEARRDAAGKPVSAGSWPKRMPLAERLKRRELKSGGAR